MKVRDYLKSHDDNRINFPFTSVSLTARLLSWNLVRILSLWLITSAFTNLLVSTAGDDALAPRYFPLLHSVSSCKYLWSYAIHLAGRHWMVNKITNSMLLLKLRPIMWFVKGEIINKSTLLLGFDFATK